MTGLLASRPAQGVAEGSLRPLLRLEAAASAAAGVAALALTSAVADALSVTPTSVRFVGILLVVLAVDALAVSAAPPRWAVPVVAAFGAAREVAFVVTLVIGLRGGLQAGDWLVAAFLAEAVVLGALELRAARRERLVAA